MEEDISKGRRSSRSSSKPPELIGEAVVSITRLEQKMVIHESQTTKFASSTTASVSEETYVQHDAMVESQNQQNKNQEETKSLKQTVKTQKTKKVKSAATQSKVNGSAAKTTKSKSVVKPSARRSESSTQSQLTTSETIRTPAGNRYQTSVTTEASLDKAKKFYESVQKGEVDMSNSVFMRFYKNVPEWWNNYPKTDFTYSPLSKSRYELAPGMWVMPNMSRRSIHARRTSIDSDTDEFEPRSNVVQYRVSIFRRIITSIWTIMTVIYTYTFGAIFGATHMTGRNTIIPEQRNVATMPRMLSPIAWLLYLARQLTKMETLIVTSLAKGQRRNLLLTLLLLLLFGVPTYILYRDGYEYIVLNVYLAEIQNKAIDPTLAYVAHIKDTLNFYAFNVTFPYLSELKEKLHF